MHYVKTSLASCIAGLKKLFLKLRSIRFAKTRTTYKTGQIVGEYMFTGYQGKWETWKPI